MRKFRNRVGLIHKLRKLRRTEELFDRRTDGAHVDKTLRRNVFRVHGAHSFSDNSFESCDTYTELVLQKFANAAYAAVAEVIDVVRRADAVVKV